MLINVENGYRDLYLMEKDKFENGDGSIFLLNTRENRYLTAKIKRIEQHSKYLKSVVEYLRAR
jgi:virulence-associated protein VapD